MIALATGGLAILTLLAGLGAPRSPSRRLTPRLPATPLTLPASAAPAALALTGLLVLWVSLPLAAALLGAALARRHLVRARSRRAQARLVTRGLPDAVDLLLLGCGAGLSLAMAHDLVAPRLASPVGEALCEAAGQVAGGRARADALVTSLAPLGERALALAHVLTDHLRYGVALAPSLERLGLELRLDRRRAAEQAAHRVPVRLLAPLVTCTLPAFGLLTVVPLLVASLRALPT